MNLIKFLGLLVGLVVWSILHGRIDGEYILAGVVVLLAVLHVLEKRFKNESKAINPVRRG